MKVDDAVETLTRFFNDLIGNLVPGAVLACGLSVMHLGPRGSIALTKALDGAGTYWLAVGVLFATGHALLALFEQVIQKILWRIHVTTKFDEVAAATRTSYTTFLTIVQEVASAGGQAQASSSWGYRDLRSVALSTSSEGGAIGRRFMFISLLCNGVGVAIAVMLLDFISCLIFAPRLLHSYAQAPVWWVQIALMLLLIHVLFRQGETFYARAMTTPFSIAIAEIKLKQHSDAAK